MKQIKSILKIISIVVSSIIILISFLFMMNAQIRKYERLQEYAMVYAKTLDESSIKNEDIYVSGKFKDEYIIVKVETKNHTMALNAMYPIEIEKQIDSGEFVIKVLFEEVSYTYFNSFLSFNLMLLSVIAFFLLAAILPIILYYLLLLIYNVFILILAVIGVIIIGIIEMIQNKKTK